MNENYITIKKSIYKSLKQQNQRLQLELQNSQKLLQLVIDNIPHSVFWKDKNSVYLGCNCNFAEDAGIGETENIIGKNDYDLPWTQEEADFFLECDNRVMKSGMPELHIIETQVQADGNQFWLDTNKIPISNAEGNVVGILGIYENITERKQVEQKLQKLNKTLKTKVKQRTEQLQESEARLSQLADNVPGMIYQFKLNLDGVISFPYVSSGSLDIYEIEPQQIYENPQLLFAQVHSDDLFELNQKIAKSAQTLQNWQHEWRIATKSGKYKCLKGISKPRLQADKSIIWDGCVVDITERKQAEYELQKLNQELESRVEERTKALHKTEAYLKKLTDNVPGIIYQFCLTPEGKMSFPYLSSGCLDIFEIEPALICENADFLFELIEPDEFLELQQTILTSAETLENWEYEWPINTPSGKKKWIKGASKPELQLNGSIIWFGCVIDVTEIKKTEEELKASQHFIKSVVDSSPNILYIYDIEEQKNIYMNQEVAIFLGFSETEVQALGKNLLSLIIHPEDLKLILRQQKKLLTVGDGDILEFEYRVKNNHGDWHWFYDRQTVFSRKEDGTVKQLLGVATNITKLKLAEIQAQQKAIELEHTLEKLQQTQSQLIQTEKMSSLGQMVAGIAHEINNPVNFIYGNLSFVTDYTQNLLELLELYQQNYPNPCVKIQEEIENIELDFLKEDLHKILKSMEEGSRRIRDIVLSLRNFSRLDEAEFKKVDIHEGIESTLMILQNRLKGKSNFPVIEVIKKYGNLPLIECYPSQLNQVFMNILANGIDALEEVNIKNNNLTPQITISTQTINKYTAQIRISDNGLGIPKNKIPKLFDPFFTTKEIGKGTGLGLSVSYQIIVDKHSGNLYCQSVLRKGTSFIIEIPITQN